MVRVRASRMRGLLYGIDISEKDEGYEKVTIKLTKGLGREVSQGLGLGLCRASRLRVRADKGLKDES